jgi:hypothetical protein
VVRWLIPLALIAGCSADRAKMVRTLGYGLAIEGGAVFAASYATSDPEDGVTAPLAIAAPLVVAGVIAIVAGRPVPSGDR